MARLISNFRGYSTIGTSWLNPSLSDLSLARQDLLNHFNTRKGERVMMPQFGSVIWDMLFEPLDETTISIIDADVRSIIKNDPRWNLESISISEGPNSLNIEVIVNYLPADETIILPLIYDKGTSTL